MIMGADFNFTEGYFAPDWSRLKRGIDVSDTLARVQALARRGSVRISAHGYDELAEDDIFVEELLAGVDTAQVVEDYPGAVHGPCVLVLQAGGDGRPIHVVWGIPRGGLEPATLVTAYRPDLSRWSSDFMRRKKP
jgi:hypothetical protein